MRRKGVAGLLFAKRDSLKHKKNTAPQEKYRYLEWTERRDDNSKEWTTTKGKTVHLDTEIGPHECSSGPVCYNKVNIHMYWWCGRRLDAVKHSLI